MMRGTFIGALLCALLVVTLGPAEAKRKGPRRFLAQARPLALGPLQIPVVMNVGASHADSGSSQGLSYYTTPQLLSDGVTDAAYWVDNGGVVQVAVEPGGVGIEFQIGAIQRAAAILDRRLLLIEDAFPGTRVSGYSTAQILTDLDTAAAWAASNGWVICPALLNDNSGGYQEQAAADPFSVYQTDLLAHESAIEAHIAARVGAGTAGWAPGCTDIRLMVNQGGAQGFGSGVPVRHPYVDDFITWTTSDDNVDLCAQFYYISIGADNLHPDQAGGIDLADAYGRCWARTIARTSARAAVLEAVEAVDVDTIRATFFAPCRLYGGCASDPPITLETTALVGQTSDSVLTYGFHFYLGGVLQTPGAISSVTFESCAAPAQRCDVTLDFASLPDFDEVSFADTAIGLGEDVPAGGGGNFLVGITGAECGDDVPCGDWPVANVLPVTSVDAGPDAGADGGVADAAPDAGVVDGGPDAGSLNNTYFGDPSSAASWTLAAGIPFNSFCHAGWGDVPVSFGAWANQWQASVGGVDRWWHGNNPNETANGCTGSGQCLLYAINGTARFHATQPAVGTRHFMAACYNTTGPSQDVWLDGVLDNGALTAAIPASAPANTTLQISQDFHGDPVDEFVWFGWAGGGSLTTSQVVDIMCATLPPDLRASPPAACSGLIVNLSDVYNIPGFQEHCSFENSPNCYNGTTLTEVSSPAYGTYPDAGVP